MPDDLRDVIERYDYRSTPYLESLLRGRAADDPLVRQFLPDARELHVADDETSDPIGDLTFSPVKGIVHRCRDRVLLKVSHACPVYCRFCFRRDMIGSNGEALRDSDLTTALAYIAEHSEIWEVILTGGDPFSLSHRRLADVLARLAVIDHVAVLRVHSRVPIVAPESLDDSYLDLLIQIKPVYLAVHVNHPDELTPPVIATLRRIAMRGVTLVSQTVLLKDVNDDVSVLEQLFRKLVLLKVRPYYLHHPDLAPGTSHFRVSIEAGQQLMSALRARVSGLCLPTYVLDIPGGFGKVPIGPAYVGARTIAGHRDVRDNEGTLRTYAG